MARTAKILSLSFLAALTLTTASVAVARADSTTWLTPEEGKSGVITGQQVTELKFEYDNRRATCKTLNFEETLIGNTKLLPFSPILEECNGEYGGVIVPVTFTMNECDFVLQGLQTDGEDGYPVAVDLSCPTGQLEAYVYTSAKHEAKNQLCIFTVKPQAPVLEESVLTNRSPTGKADVWLDVVVFYNATRDGSALCGQASAEAKLTAKITLRAFDKEGSQVDLKAGHETA